jgi:hypothetical protein
VTPEPGRVDGEVVGLFNTRAARSSVDQSD